jgi:hypothetical protein
MSLVAVTFGFRSARFGAGFSDPTMMNYEPRFYRVLLGP